MYIKNIQVQAYRNLEDQRVDLDEGINLFLGDNGHGKTNVLEAVYVLTTLRSFRTTSTRELIRHGSQSAELRGLVNRDGVPLELRARLDPNGKRLWLGGNVVRKSREYLGRFKVVAFTPDDLAMVKGAPSVRRQFLDRSVFLFHPDHLRRVKEYDAALRARNKLLKESARPNREVLDSFGQAMSVAGAEVSWARRDLIERLDERAAVTLAGIEQMAPRLKLTFKPGWAMGEGKDPGGLLRQLNDDYPQDCRRGQTSHGSQQDDFEISLESRQARRFASQGQQRACAVSLLLAVIREMAEEGFDQPAILLDDVSSELDMARREKLFEQVLELGSQVLITTTDETLVEGLTAKAGRRFRVHQGRVIPGENER